MNDREEIRETCAVCGNDASDGRWFCHFYSERGTASLCSPACAEAYLDRPAGTGQDTAVRSPDRADPEALLPR